MESHSKRHGVTHLVHRIPKRELSNNPAVHLGKLCFETILHFGRAFVRSASTTATESPVPGRRPSSMKFSDSRRDSCFCD
jgi:hypothetical protein